MGLLKFRLPPSLPPDVEFRRAYVTGPDRTPMRVQIEVRSGLLNVHRESPESGRLNVPWPIQGWGMPFVATATLSERHEPYDLGVELARGKLNDVRNQLADWRQAGLAVPAEAEQSLSVAQRAFARAATSQDWPEVSSAASGEALRHTFDAGRRLVEVYASQVLRKRLSLAPKLPTLLAVGLNGPPKGQPWAAAAQAAINTARLSLNWASIAPVETDFRWEASDAQLHWCRKKRLIATAGPLIDLRRGALPDWLWLWQGDFEEILAQAGDLVRQAVARYRGKIAVWHVVARPASSEVLGLTEEDQIRLTARLIQIARQADPEAQLVIDLDRPWAEWLSTSDFQLGPLHLADSLARADLGLGGIGLEIAPGYSAPGSPMRDLFDFSRLLDLYALINLPLHVTFAFPSDAGPDPRAEESIQVEPAQWPRPPDEAIQEEFAAPWLALAAAKPFVQSVTWLQATDAPRHLYPHAGLFRPDQSPKPAFSALQRLHQKIHGD